VKNKLEELDVDYQKEEIRQVKKKLEELDVDYQKEEIRQVKNKIEELDFEYPKDERVKTRKEKMVSSKISRKFIYTPLRLGAIAVTTTGHMLE